jgi:hypothetical protein
MENVPVEGGSNGPKMGRLEGKNIIVTGAAGYVKAEIETDVHCPSSPSEILLLYYVTLLLTSHLHLIDIGIRYASLYYPFASPAKAFLLSHN